MAGNRELTLLVIRHAKSTANAKNILAGRSDPTPLTSKGFLEARALSDVVKEFNPEQVISSPLLRCRQTVAEAGISDVILDERLIEMDYGRWTGRKIRPLSLTPSWKRIQQDASNFVFPDGEGFLDAKERINALIADLREDGSSRVALFTHGDIARILINSLLGRELNSFQQIQISTSSHSRLSLIPATRSRDAQTIIHYLNRKENSAKETSMDHSGLPVDNSFKLGGD